MIYQVLIVDDEPGIAEGLRILVERLIPECQVIGLAYNGKQGYDSAFALKPDIVLTDIRMPEMDGIEMAEHLVEDGFQGRIIILSGYAEFEYAKKAIRLGVEEYIMKPAEEQELISVFAKACKAIEKVRSIEDTLDRYNKDMKLYVMKDILMANKTEREEIRELMDSAGFFLFCKQYGCAVFEDNRDDSGTPECDFNQLTEEAAILYFDFCKTQLIIPFSDRWAVLVLGFDSEVTADDFLNTLRKTWLGLQRKAGGNVSVGISVLHHDADEIREAFEEAKCALNYKVIKGPSCMISYGEIKDISGQSELVTAEDIERLEDCINHMDDAKCIQVIEDIFCNIEKESNLSLVDLQLLSLNLILSGIRKMPFMQFQLNEYLKRNILSMESVSKFQTIEQLKNWTINTLRSINELAVMKPGIEKRDIIEEVREYIAKNYNKEISLNDISERFFISPFYLSQLFKKKTGENYKNYVATLRINRAKRLLEETELKIYEVCAMVGYSDTKHFNQMFERQVGMKPVEYKKKFQS